MDASPHGLGGILAQKQADGTLKPIRFGSRALTDVETRYSQTEREALAVRWACEHFHHFIFNRHFTVKTDHKPLERLLSANSNPPPRIQRWLLYLQAYDYKIVYVRSDPIAADYLSRYHPFTTNDHTLETSDAENHINSIVINAVPKSLTLSSLVQETNKDSILQQVISCMNRNNWSKTDKDILPYLRVK